MHLQFIALSTSNHLTVLSNTNTICMHVNKGTRHTASFQDEYPVGLTLIHTKPPPPKHAPVIVSRGAHDACPIDPKRTMRNHSTRSIRDPYVRVRSAFKRFRAACVPV